MTTENETEFVTTAGAAKMLDVKPETVESWRRRGEGPSYYRVGKAVRYRRDDLAAWLASRIVRPEAA